MKKKAEMLQKINALRKTVLDLLQAGKTDEAKTQSDELTKLMAEYEKMPEDKTSGGMKAMDKKERLNQIRKAVNAYLHRGWNAMEDSLKQVLKPINATEGTGQVETVTNRGGVLVPVETAAFVARMDTGVYRLRDRVDEYFTQTKSGKIPLLANPTAGLVAQFDEMPTSGIAKGQITFGSVDFNVADYGLIVPVSNDLISDATVDVFGVIADQFARAQVITEDTMILSAIDGMIASVEAVTDWKGIAKALNGTAPVGSPDKVIVTNTDGYNYLDTLVDDNGRPILTQALVDNPRRIFRGYEVIQLPNDILPTATPEAGHDYGAIPFYVGQLRDAVMFIERRGLEIAYNPYSDSAFGKNSVDVRVTCRLDCKGKFDTAIKKLTYTPANDD